MGESYKLNGGRGKALYWLLYRIARFIIVLNIFILFFYFFEVDNRILLLAEALIFALAIFIYASKREVERLSIEGNKIYITGRWFIFFKFKESADFSRVRYKFNKPSEKKRNALTPKSTKLVLYKNKRKWAEFTIGSWGWSRIVLADIVRALISKGCYNWFEFNKR